MRRRALRRLDDRAAAARAAASRRPSAAPAPPPTRAAPDTATPLAERLDAMARRRAVRAGVVVVALAFFAIQGLVVARTDTPTVDEFVYLPAGYYHLRTGDLEFDSTNPPLMKMAMALPLLAMDLQLDTDPRWRDNRTGWGPWVFGTRFMDANAARYLDVFLAARLVILALAVSLGVLLYVRARALLSPTGALAALALFASMPPMIAHSSLATLDLGVTALVFAAFVALARFIAAWTWPWAAAVGALLGLAFAAKGVAAFFVPVVLVLLAISWWSRRPDVRSVAAGLGAMLLGAWVAVLVVYRFEGFPLPAPLIEGVRFQLAASSAGEFPAFLAGEWSQTGWWHYYLVALALKTPLPSLVLIAIGAVAIIRRRARGASDLWLMLPPLFLLYVLSFHYGKNYGVRYLLPAFPFLILIAGVGVDVLLRRGRWGGVVALALVGWQLATAVAIAPYHLPYFNELAGGPERARRLLLDSNLDWGQDLGRLAAYLERRRADRVFLGYFGHVDPKLYGIAYTLAPQEPTPGLYAISANFLAGYGYAVTYAGERILGVRRNAWAWLDHQQPVARVGRSIYVFDVSEEDARRARAATSATGRS